MGRTPYVLKPIGALEVLMLPYELLATERGRIDKNHFLANTALEILNSLEDVDHNKLIKAYQGIAASIIDDDNKDLSVIYYRKILALALKDHSDQYYSAIEKLASKLTGNKPEEAIPMYKELISYWTLRKDLERLYDLHTRLGLLYYSLPPRRGYFSKEEYFRQKKFYYKLSEKLFEENFNYVKSYKKPLNSDQQKNAILAVDRLSDFYSNPLVKKYIEASRVLQYAVDLLREAGPNSRYSLSLYEQLLAFVLQSRGWTRSAEAMMDSSHTHRDESGGDFRLATLLAKNKEDEKKRYKIRLQLRVAEEISQRARKKSPWCFDVNHIKNKSIDFAQLNIERDVKNTQEVMFREIILDSTPDLEELLRQSQYSIDLVGKASLTYRDIPVMRDLPLRLSIIGKARSIEELSRLSLITHHEFTSAEHEQFSKTQELRKKYEILAYEAASALPTSDAQYLAREVLSAKNDLDAAEQNGQAIVRKYRNEDSEAVDKFFPSIPSLQKVLPAEAALIEFIRFQPLDCSEQNWDGKHKPPQHKYMAYVITPSKVDLVDLGEADPINKLVWNYSSALANPDSVWLPLADAAYQRIFSVIRPYVADRTVLFIAPDDELGLLPFGLLHDPLDDVKTGTHRQVRVLLDQYRFVYVNSGRDLLRDKAADPSTDIVLYGDPDYDAKPEEGAPRIFIPTAPKRTDITRTLNRGPIHRLKGFADELTALHKSFPAARLLVDKDATESAFTNLRAPGVLHVITHGLYLQDRDPARVQWDPEFPTQRGTEVRSFEHSPSDPMLRSILAAAGYNSYLQLAPDTASPSASNGIVTALAVSGMNLWGTQLVVLSACETGRGEVERGLGVFGLRRAFMIAGAEALVSTLWQINDPATAKFMDLFYGFLLSGQGPARGRAEALRRAALKLRDNYPHSYYWGAFILSGDPSPLRNIH